MLLRPQYKFIAPAALYGGGSILQEDYTSSDTMTWVTHARTGHATRWDSTGKLTWAPNNLILQSNTFVGNGWGTTNATLTSGVSDPLSGTSATTLKATSNGGYVGITLTDTTPRMLNAIWVKRRTGTGSVYLYSADSNFTTISTTGSWQQFSIYSSASGSAFFAVQLATANDEVDIYHATMSRVTYETSARASDDVVTTTSAYYGPRFDYNPATLAKRGLLREMSRTNALQYSNDFSNAWWNKNSCTVTAATATGPDGTTSMSTAAASVAGGWVLGAVARSTNTQYCASIFTKAIDDYVSIYIGNGGNVNGDGGRLFRISTGTSSVIGNAVDGYGVIDCGGGIKRIYVVFTTPGTAGNIDVIFQPFQDSGGSVAGSVYIYGAQLEVGGFPTSYIPTTSASVTRAADDLTAALYTADSVTEYYRLVSDLSQSSRTVNPFSGVTDETDSVWIERFTKP